jgi:hypothetical protein
MWCDKKQKERKNRPKPKVKEPKKEKKVALFFGGNSISTKNRIPNKKVKHGLKEFFAVDPSNMYVVNCEIYLGKIYNPKKISEKKLY